MDKFDPEAAKRGEKVFWTNGAGRFEEVHFVGLSKEGFPVIQATHTQFAGVRADELRMERKDNS